MGRLGGLARIAERDRTVCHSCGGWLLLGLQEWSVAVPWRVRKPAERCELVLLWQQQRGAISLANGIFRIGDDP